MAMLEANVNVTVESVVTKVMMDFAQKIFDEHELRIHAIEFTWSEDEKVATSVLISVERDLIIGKAH